MESGGRQGGGGGGVREGRVVSGPQGPTMGRPNAERSCQRSGVWKMKPRASF